MRQSLVRTLGIGLLIGVLGACGDSDPVTPDPDPDPDPDPRVVLANPAFGANIQEIFDRRGCTASQCHGASPGQAMLNLSSGAAHGQLVGIPSFQVPTSMRVVAGDADASYLVMKLLGTGQQGQMPQGGQPLDMIDMDNIRNWINTGAANN